jgi:hypothetical protein
MSDGTTFWSLFKKKRITSKKIVKHGKHTQHFFTGLRKRGATPKIMACAA